jgi:hypothetical protein
LQGNFEAPISKEQHLSPGSLRSEHFEGLTEKVGKLVVRAARKNPFGTAKKRAKKTKMAEAVTGTSDGAQPRLPQGGQKQRLQQHSLYGSQERGEGETWNP